MYCKSFTVKFWKAELQNNLLNVSNTKDVDTQVKIMYFIFSDTLYRKISKSIFSDTLKPSKSSHRVIERTLMVQM